MQIGWMHHSDMSSCCHRYRMIGPRPRCISMAMRPFHSVRSHWYGSSYDPSIKSPAISVPMQEGTTTTTFFFNYTSRSINSFQFWMRPGIMHSPSLFSKQFSVEREVLKSVGERWNRFLRLHSLLESISSSSFFSPPARQTYDSYDGRTRLFSPSIVFLSIYAFCVWERERELWVCFWVWLFMMHFDLA